MPPEIERLLVLQNRDQKLSKLSGEIASWPAARAAIEERLAQASAALKSMETALREAELERARLDGDVKAKEASIAKFKTQQQQTRKNEEYQALAHEIERYQADISLIEDKELEVMEKIEALKAGHQEAAENFRREKSQVEEEMKALEARLKALEAQREALKSERETLAAEVPADVLSLYERILKAKRDAAVVAVEHDVCTGCHMKLTMQTTVKVRAGKGIVHCENCGRMLYEGG